ncbi:MAG: DNA-binding response regulator [marine bacterium B5-7]|nr:MAG: DNA-binding response regulator [marine bacterium B5-7]
MKVLLIDDHALFRVGLEGLLDRRGITVVAAVGEPQQGPALVIEHQPDVVLLDLRMPELSGIQLLQELTREHPDLPVVMLTTSSDEQDLAECLRNGARGYLLKDMEPDELVVALRDIVAGKTIVAAELTGVLANLVKHGSTSERREQLAPFNELTPREMEILCHLSEGQSNKVIARNLNISDGTVKLHVKAILRKLNVHSRVEAAVMAVEKGLCGKGPNKPFE